MTKQLSIVAILLLMAYSLMTVSFRSSESKPLKTGYFYFLIESTKKGKPTYFSQVVALSYKDNIELIRKQDSCVLLLRKAAGNPAGYNDKGSGEKENEDEAKAERADNIKHLQTAGVKVVEKTI